jgi:3',5'-cyclic AMP phosphodiesterase CpdA
MTKVAQISDIHLSPLPRIKLKQLFSKRATGYANWIFSRKASMPHGLLAQLTEHLCAQKPDMIAVSGDLVNLSLPGEIEAARAWLEALGDPDKVAVVPGNHDAYVPGALDAVKNSWGDYMKGMTLSDHDFPFWRQEDGVALIGCSSAIVTPPFFAHGAFDEEQGERLREILKLTKQAGLYRIVMIHHPPHDEVRQIWRRGLHGRELFRDIIKDQGADLVLHGHLHKSMVTPIEGPSGEVPVIGVASAAAGNGGKSAPARYNLFDIRKVGSSYECLMTEYGYQRVGDGISKRLEILLH